MAALALMAMSRDKNRQPAAYLNYLLFDDNMKLLDGGYVGVSEAANFNKEELNSGQIKAKGSGVLYVYLSNEREDGKPVYYDDFSLSVTSTPQWKFYSKDHLGSTRVVFNESNQFESAMDYMPFGEIMREHNVGETAYQYTGQEYDKESGIHNYRARLYDSDLCRFYGMDPQEEFPSPFSYAGNNPVMNVDPDGESVVSLLAAMAKGAAIGIAGNGINNTIHNQSFFSGGGQAAAYGALGGGISHGIGLGAQALANGGANALQVGAFQAGAHALSGGLQSELAGGNFGSGFLSGGISSVIGSVTAGAGDAGQLIAGIYSGGIGSLIGGGNFIDGARMGAITVGLNHLAEKAQKVNLGNSNHRELTNEMMKSLYNSFNGGSNYLEDIFDYTNVGKNFNENRGYGRVN